MKKLNILVIHDGTEPLPDEKYFDLLASNPEWSTEISVIRALQNCGYKNRFVSFYDKPSILIDEINRGRPDAVFNLAEAYLGQYRYEMNIPSLLELLGVPYTGCGPIGLMICNNKAITKKILVYHNIMVPRFCVFKIGETVKFPPIFNPPFFIKPLQEEASVGISQNSYAKTYEQCISRIQFLHEHLKKDALVEEYIEGRELYVGIIGNKKDIKAFPIWELKFTNMPDNELKIATFNVKWNANYRKKYGIKSEHADKFHEETEEKIYETCKKAYMVLNLDGYARFDLRLTPNDEIYIIEANANPQLAKGEEFAASAEKDGLSYDNLIEKIILLALRRRPY